MAQLTAEMLLAKVREQGGRIAELELINGALASENTHLQALVAQLTPKPDEQGPMDPNDPVLQVAAEIQGTASRSSRRR